MTPLPVSVKTTGLIVATVLAAAGLNLGVMSLGQADGGGADVDTAATPTSAELVALNDTAPAAAEGQTDTTLTVATIDPAATDPALDATTVAAAGGSVTPGLPVAGAAQTSAAPATSAASTATTQPTTATTRPASSQTYLTTPVAPTAVRPSTTAPPTTARTTTAPPTTARPTTAAPTTARPTTAAPTTSTTRAQAVNYNHTVTGAGSLVVSVTDRTRLALVTASANTGWTATTDTNQADLIKVVFTRRGNEIAVSVTLRNGEPVFTEERNNDD